MTRRFRYFVLTAIVLLTTCPMVCATTVGYWRFAEGLDGQVASGPDSILDVSGAANHGTPFGGPVYSNVANSGSSIGLRFDGLDDRIFIPDDPSLALTESLTVEAFIRIDSIPFTPGNMQIVFRGDNRPSLDPYFLALDRNTGKLFFSIQDATNTMERIYSPTALPVGIPLHVAGTLDDASGAMRLFVNAQPVASVVTAIRPFADLSPTDLPGFAIGNLETAGAQYFHGIIDDVRVSDRALDPDEFLFLGGSQGDVNGDGIVNVGDLALVGAQWNTPGAFPNADIDFSGTVSVGDLGIVAAHWTAMGGASGSSFGSTTIPVPPASIMGLALLYGVGLTTRRR